MAKNLIPQICELLGVEVGEVFTIKGYEKDEFRISEKYGLVHRHRTFQEEWQIMETMFTSLIYGRSEIVKLPWKPKENELFWSFYVVSTNKRLIVIKRMWDSDATEHLAFYKAGWIFRTREEAEAALPKVAEELGVEYEL